MTEEEVLNWLDMTSLDELIAFVQDYDYVEHVKPNFNQPKYALVIQDRNVVLTPIYDNDSNDTLTLGHLTYDIYWETQTYKNVIPPKTFPWKESVISLLIGFVAGFVATLF